MMSKQLLIVRTFTQDPHEKRVEINILTTAEQTYSKHSMSALRVDSHFTVIEAALKGYVKWRRYHGHDHVSSKDAPGQMK